MLINRYLHREILNPLVTICSVLVAIFAGYSATRYLPDAAKGLLTGKTVLVLVSLKVLIALEVLIPITLFISVITVLGRLHRESEIVALYASGMNERTLIRSVLQISVVTAMLVASLSLYVRPWAYEKSYWLKADAKANFDFSRLRPGHFHEIGEDRYVVFIEGIDEPNQRVTGVFIEQRDETKRKITRANEAWQETHQATEEKSIVLRDGYHYEIGADGGKTEFTRFQNFQLMLTPKQIESIGNRRKATSTAYLADSQKKADKAEFQWRISTGVSTILLGLLGIPLSRTAPRRGKSANVFIGVIIFAFFYNMTAVAKTWMEQGIVGSVPGIWWPHILLVLLLLFLLKPFRSGFHLH